MKPGLRIIIIENDKVRMDIIVRELRQAKLLQTWQNVADAEQLRYALEQKTDLIISYYFLPNFSALEALSILREKNIEIPLIVISHTDDSETAVECMKAGAFDYIPTLHLFRLADTVREIHNKTTQKNLHYQRVEKALKLTKYAVDHSPFPIFWLNKEGFILWGNEAILTLLGYDLPLFSTLHIGQIDSIMSIKNWPQIYKRFSKSEVNLKSHLKTKDKKNIKVDLYVQVVTHDEQEFIFVFVKKALSEIPNRTSPQTAVKSNGQSDHDLQKQIDQLQKLAAFGRLSSGVVHDFNNLLTIINGYSELLSLSLKTNDHLHSYVDLIMKTCGRGASLSKQLLGFSRRLPSEQKIIELNTVITDMITMLRRVVRENIELYAQLEKNSGHIKADAAELEQIIINLVVNARDAMPQGGKLLIETSVDHFSKVYYSEYGKLQTGHYIVLTIQDSGQGMTEEVKKNLFTPFFTTKVHGTGLGLATVYNYIQRSSALIECYSKLGKGTMFKLFFPRIDAPVEKEKKQKTRCALSGGLETILIVEDEEEVRQLTSRMLQMQGYHILNSRSGDDALSLCKNYTEPIDLLIADMMLPNINGLELYTRLKKGRPNLRALFISGYGNAAEVKLSNNGNNGFTLLEKPFTMDKLTRTIRKVLNNHL